jgi:hypothetical protein
MKFIWRYFSWLFSLPLMLGAICFAVGNREPTIITLWPFGIAYGLPIYLLALVPLGCGLLCGGLMQWVGSLRHRVAAQRLGKEVAKLKGENAELRAQLAQVPTTTATPAIEKMKQIAGLRQ